MVDGLVEALGDLPLPVDLQLPPGRAGAHHQDQPGDTLQQGSARVVLGLEPLGCTKRGVAGCVQAALDQIARKHQQRQHHQPQQDKGEPAHQPRDPNAQPQPAQQRSASPAEQPRNGQHDQPWPDQPEYRPGCLGNPTYQGECGAPDPVPADDMQADRQDRQQHGPGGQASGE